MSCPNCGSLNVIEDLGEKKCLQCGHTWGNTPFVEGRI